MSYEEMLEKALIVLFGVYDRISESWHIEGSLKERDFVISIISKLYKRGVRFVSHIEVLPLRRDRLLVVQIPKNSLGIRYWGYVDYLRNHINANVALHMNMGMHSEFSPAPRTRRVSDVDKDRLEQKKKLHAKRPYKHAAVK